jgi:hypothetical protein
MYSRGNVRLFRNNVGAAFMGPHLWTGDGAVVVTRPTRVKFGLAEGSPDLVGWRSRVITQDMVGCRIAQFVGIEVKSSQGRASPTQRAFLKQLADHGGLVGVARTEAQAERVLRGYRDVE